MSKEKPATPLFSGLLGRGKETVEFTTYELDGGFEDTVEFKVGEDGRFAETSKSFRNKDGSSTVVSLFKGIIGRR